MEQILNVIAIIAFTLFIIVQVYDLVNAHKTYKQMKMQHQKIMKSLKGGEINGSKQVQKSSKTKTKSKHND